MKKTQESKDILGRAMTSGTLGGLAVAITASIAGKRENGSYSAPLNATSHIIWGNEAAREDSASLKYTLTGFLLNHASAIFWALFYEKWFGGRRGPDTRGAESRKASAKGPIEAGQVAKPILGAAAVTAGAYITDYHLIPERFTPGFEKRLSGKSLAAIFAALAVGLAARDLIDAVKTRRT